VIWVKLLCKKKVSQDATLDGQTVENKLQLCRSQFLTFTSTWQWQIKKNLCVTWVELMRELKIW